MEGVERILELVSWAIAFIKPAKLSLPGVMSPKAATKPWVFNKDDKAVVDRVTLVPSAALPAIATRSGPAPLNLVIPTGTLFLSLPE